MPGHAAALRTPDPDLEAREVGGAQLRDQGADSVVPPGTSIHAEFQGSERKRHVVINHQDLRGLDLEKTGRRRHRPAAQVHVGLGFEQPHSGGKLDHLGLPLELVLELRPRVPRQPVQDLEADIVPRSGVLPPGVSQPHHHARRLLHACP